MSEIIYSNYQKDFFQAITKTTKNIVLIAVAGSGKSFSLLNAVKLLPMTTSVGLFAFNKAIVEDWTGKCKLPNVEIKTLHSAGFSSLMFTYRSKLDNYKYRKFLNDSIFLLSDILTIDTKENELLEYKNRTLKLLDLSRVSLSSTVEEIEALAEKHEVDIESDEAKVVLKLQNWGQNNCKIIDFTDMVWLPVIKNLNIKQYDFVGIDEAQDLSKCQRELFLKMLKPTSRFVAVGDPRQCINGFAEADLESFNKLRSLPNVIELPLSICYRCPKAVIKEAQSIVPYIETSENASEGEVNTVQNIDNIQAGDMVLSRVTSPLVSLCMKLIGAGKPAYVKGREIGTSLSSLVKRTKQVDLELMNQMLENELYKIQIKISKRNGISMEEAKDEYAYLAFTDKMDCINTISFGCSNTGELLAKIDSLFKDNGQGVILSTIHKSKGLEADNIYIIALDKFPLKRCMDVEWKREQEYNLMYVAITRAKKTLNYVDCDIKNLKIK